VLRAPLRAPAASRTRKSADFQLVIGAAEITASLCASERRALSSRLRARKKVRKTP